MKHIIFYKYVPLHQLKGFKKEHLAFCKSLGLKGKVLVAKEGINGSLSGREKDIEQYIKGMRKDKRFADILFKKGKTREHTFKRMHVTIKKEIIASRLIVDLGKRAPYIEPKELKGLLDKGEELVLLDARNDYEYKLGRFSQALDPKLKTFQQFKKVVKQCAGLKDKLIVTYCTGGVRCEKASAFLVDQGFTNVRQLHGGIIQYGLECGDAHWEGKCFVFDQRGAIEIDPAKQGERYEQCGVCFTPCEEKHSCVYCEKEFVACEECLGLYQDCCSKFCRNSLRERNI